MRHTQTIVTAVLLMLAPGTPAGVGTAFAAELSLDARVEPPVIITAPGPEFQDDARPGAMILGMVLDELERTGKQTALITLCVAAGMGVATIIERV